MDLRPITEDEFDDWRQAFSVVFGFDPRDEDRDVFAAVNELDRSIGVFDEGAIVGTGGAFTFEMTVPGGGQVGAGGVTLIAVMPTHRRRGILTEMMRHQLRDVREREEPAAILWASESLIYGRYGYGVAIEGTDLKIATDRAALRSDVPAPLGAMRVVTDPAEAAAVLPGVYEASTVQAGIPGTLARSKPMWDIYFHDPEHWRDGLSSLRFGVYERDGEPAGFVRYRQKMDWPDMHPAHSVTVGDLIGVDGEAYAALWRFALGLDLVSEVKALNRPLLDPLGSLLMEPRRIRRAVGDTIWVRLVDVPTALASRRYAVPGRLVLEVVDDFMPEFGGRFVLEGGPEGATCGPTSDEPDLTLRAEDLGSAFLGDSRLATLHWLGRVAGSPEAAVRAQAMFGWQPGPWCTVHF